MLVSLGHLAEEVLGSLGFYPQGLELWDGEQNGGLCMALETQLSSKKKNNNNKKIIIIK